MMNSIKDLELPKDDSRCASILRTVIRNLKEKEKEKENERSASSSSSISQECPNEVYALRQKMLGGYLPYTSIKTESRSASTISNVRGPNQVYELRKVLFGSYS